MLRPAEITIPHTGLDIVIPQPGQSLFRLPSQRFHHLHAVDLFDQLRQHRTLVARTGTDLQHRGISVHRKQLGHQRHDIGLGDGLAMTDRERPVGIGKKLHLRWNELMARHRFHRLHHLFGEFRVAGVAAGNLHLEANILEHVLHLFFPCHYVPSCQEER